MGHDPVTSRSGASSSKDQLRFALLLGVVGAALITAIVVLRPRGLGLGRSLQTVTQAVDARHRLRQAQVLRAACKEQDCACAEAAAGAGLDVDAGSAVVALLDAAKSCKFSALAGMRAEALVRAGSKDGLAGTLEVLKGNERDAHAMTAMGIIAYRAGQAEMAAATLDRAVAGGAGDGARAVLGLASYQRNDWARARAAFEALLASEPEDLDATYNLALVAQKQDRYGEARKLYLKVLRASPKRHEARYNLAILAHSIGADQEAKHHLERLEKAAPGDPMLASLREELAKPSKKAGQVLTLGAPPTSSGR